MPEGFKIIKDMSTKDIVAVVATDELIYDSWIEKANEYIAELYNGMYLASACQLFIEWQNSFLQPIVDANKFNGILHNYVDKE